MTKKTFHDNINPAINFISQESINYVDNIDKEVEKPNGYKLNPLYIETKSKRLQLLITPSLYEKLKQKSKNDNTSINSIVNNILRDIFTD